MGLATTHDCWVGPYGLFARWREDLCEAAGYGDLNEYQGFRGDKPWPRNGDVLIELLNHSDCDGVLEWNICAPLADRLEELLPRLEEWGWEIPTRTFIVGLRLADERREDVEFY